MGDASQVPEEKQDPSLCDAVGGKVGKPWGFPGISLRCGAPAGGAGDTAAASRCPVGASPTRGPDPELLWQSTGVFIDACWEP